MRGVLRFLFGWLTCIHNWTNWDILEEGDLTKKVNYQHGRYLIQTRYCKLCDYTDRRCTVNRIDL